MSRTPALAAAPNVIGGPGVDFTCPLGEKIEVV
jgi:hypothetical protein